MNYTLVESESELQARLKQGACVVAAGMTDLYPSGQLNHTDRDLLDITRVASLSGIIPTDDGWRIGATTSWRAILDYPWPPGLALLAEVAGQVGAVQVQNAATVAGNLCNASPAADSVPALLALDATVELASASGTRMLPLADFITGVRRTAIRDDEYLRAICLPAVPEPDRATRMKIEFSLNGETLSCDGLSGAERLSSVLRERCGARDVKVGCEAGDCGACTVLIDGDAFNACIVSAAQAHGRSVETADGLHRGGDTDAQRVADAFHAHGAVQCGICFPGMLTSLVALKRRDRQPSESTVSDALGGVLCRCSGYRKLLDAAVAACGPDPLMPIETDGAVGDSVARVDGLSRITGAEAFGDDVAPPDALLLRLVRSPHAHADFALGDLAAWVETQPGVEMVLSAADIPGVNRFGVIPGFEDQPVFAETRVRFRGEAVAAVVGDHAVISALDLADFPVTWNPLTGPRGYCQAWHV